MATGTVIDSLVLSLGIDPTNFTAGQKQALDSLRRLQEEAQAGGKQVESQTKRMTDTLMSFRREAVSTLGMFLGGMGVKQFINTVTNLDATVGRLGKTMGQSAEEVSTWQGMIQQVGGSSESANASLQGLNGEMVRFSLTGQSSMLGVLTQLGVSLYDQNHNLKTSVVLYRDLTEAIEKRKLSARDAAGLLSMIPGMNQDTINLILKGTKAFEAYQKAAREAGGTTKESAAAAEEYQRSISALDRSATNLGRTITTALTPALTAAFDAMTKFIKGPSDDVIKATEKLTGQSSKEASFFEKLGSALFAIPAARDNKRYAITPFGLKESRKAIDSSPEVTTVPKPQTGARATNVEREAYIRRAAAARGIDPDIAVRVARSEGLGGAYSGDRGSSFGDFQLHYGGMASGGMAGKGLGDSFTKKTGLDAKDPATWRQQADFALDEAAKRGWGDWHGWKGDSFAGIGARGAAGANAAAAGGGGQTKTITTTIDNVNVNAPHATDAPGIAQEIAPALQRAVDAGAANYGSN